MALLKTKKKNKEKLLKGFFCHHKSVTLVESVTEVQNWTKQSTPPRMNTFLSYHNTSSYLITSAKEFHLQSS